MIDNIIKKFLILFSGSFFNIIIGLITTPLITRIAPPEEYGQYSFFNMYTNLFVLVFGLGLDQALVRYFNEVSDRKLLIKKVTSLPIILSIIFSITLIIGGRILNVNKYMYIIICMFIINLIFMILNKFTMLTIRMNQKVKLYSCMLIMQKVTYIVVVIILANISDINKALVLMAGITISHILTTIIALFLGRNDKKEYEIDTVDEVMDISFKELIKYSYPYIFTFAITWLFQSIDKIAINKYSGFSEVGFYSGAINIITIISLVQTTFNTLWVPIAFEHYHKSPDDKDFFVKVTNIVSLGMITLGITLILFKDILIIFLGPAYRESVYIFPFLVLQPIMYTISETTVNGINFMKQTKWHIVIALVSCIANVIGNYMLVPVLGAKGAAISTGLSYVIFFMTRTYISKLLFDVKYKLSRIYLCIIGIIIFATYNSFNNFDIVIIVTYGLFILSIIYLYNDIIKEGLVYVVDRYKVLRNRGETT